MGRTELFDSLFESHRNAVFSYFLGKTGLREDSLDLTQEVFSRAWARNEDASAVPPDRQRYWLFAIAKNSLVDYRRRAKVREVALKHLKSSQTESTSNDLQCATEQSILVESLEEAIMDLPKELRTVLVMSVMGEIKSNEIAELLGRPAGTIRSLIHEARQQLRRYVTLAGQI